MFERVVLRPVAASTPRSIPIRRDQTVPLKTARRSIRARVFDDAVIKEVLDGSFQGAGLVPKTQCNDELGHRQRSAFERGNDTI